MSLTLAGCATTRPPAASTEHSARPVDDAAAREQLGYVLGVQAYIYGYPLVVMEKTRQGTPTPGKPSFAETMNQFRHATNLLTHENRAVVAPNSDTIYSSAWLDLTAGPLVMHLPDTAGRYYVMQFLDEYSNSFAHLGRRTTGTKAGDHLIVGPDWKGTAPAGMNVVHSPTNLVWTIARFLVDGSADLPNVAALQAQLKLTPLEGAAATDNPPASTAAIAKATTLPAAQKAPADKLAFYKALGGLLQKTPPPAPDAVLLAQFESIGLSATSGFHVPDDATAAGLARAVPAAESIIDSLSRRRGVVSNGWRWNPKMGAFGDDFLLRALTAKTGLAALVPEEAVYFSTYADDANHPMTGDSKYVLHFGAGQLPPVDAFWSITLYARDHFLVDNVIHRYAIGDRTPGMAKNPDGSLDIYVQHDTPAGKEANWLPTPIGEFYLVVRAYQPRPEILNSTYKLPAPHKLQ